MVQEVAEHEATWLILHSWHLFETCAVNIVIFTRCTLIHIVRFFKVLVLCVFLVRNGVFSSLLIELALHQDVKEHGYGSTVSQLSVDVNGPEEGMGGWVLSIREAH